MLNFTGQPNLTSHQSSLINETLRHQPAVSCWPAGGTVRYQPHSSHMNVNMASINHINFIGVKFLLCLPDQSDDIITVSLERQTQRDEGRKTEGFVGGSGAHLILRETQARMGKCGEHQTHLCISTPTSQLKSRI